MLLRFCNTDFAMQRSALCSLAAGAGARGGTRGSRWGTLDAARTLPQKSSYMLSTCCAAPPPADAAPHLLRGDSRFASPSLRRDSHVATA